MRHEDVDEPSLFGLAYALEIKDLAKIRVGAVADMDEICLHKRLWWGWPDLYGLEKRIQLAYDLVDSFYETATHLISCSTWIKKWTGTYPAGGCASPSILSLGSSLKPSLST